MFQDGLAQCPCRPAYRPTPGMSRACTACGSGFWLRDGICARRARAPAESRSCRLPAPAAEPAPGAAPGGGGDPGARPREPGASLLRGQAEPGCWAGASCRERHEDVPGLPELTRLGPPARGWPEQPGVCQQRGVGPAELGTALHLAPCPAREETAPFEHGPSALPWAGRP
ncbi:translation initiation factor IF-2-like [Chelonia mydas]|uniref:translation initiation factor IF-2-like n=1 Tax=Chelonia mydas TaxID=8469 RepID=UPI0018A1B7EF|nr:translation initiation factor IF-2-like [Chelonia mydas]